MYLSVNPCFVLNYGRTSCVLTNLIAVYSMEFKKKFQDEIKMLTHLCAKREAEYARQENDLKTEREGLVKRGFVAQNRLQSNQKAYEKKLEAMTKTYKKVIDVSITGLGLRIVFSLSMIYH